MCSIDELLEVDIVLRQCLMRGVKCEVFAIRNCPLCTDETIPISNVEIRILVKIMSRV